MRERENNTFLSGLKTKNKKEHKDLTQCKRVNLLTGKKRWQIHKIAYSRGRL